MAFIVYQRIPIFNMLNQSNAFISITLETFVVKINITAYKFIFQATLLDFGWRSAFIKVSLPMAHCITTAIEDFSAKILQQEQNERSSTLSYALNLVNVQQVWQDSYVVPEADQPKKIAKASVK